jgi:hypothetical protein
MLTSLLLLIALLGLIATRVVQRVPEGQVFSLYRRGKPLRLLGPGLHWRLPLLERVAHRIDLGGRVLRFEEPLADAHDVRGTVYWQVLEPERADAVIDEADQLIRHGALDALRREAAPVQADRRDLGGRLKQALNALLRERGMMVTRVELEIA